MEDTTFWIAISGALSARRRHLDRITSLVQLAQVTSDNLITISIRIRIMLLFMKGIV